MDNYKSYTITAPALYSISKAAFYRAISDCDVSFVVGYSQMFINFRNVHDQTRVKRRELMVLFLAHADKQNISKFTDWLLMHFDPKMQSDIFELTVHGDGNITYNKMLEKALNNYRKR